MAADPLNVLPAGYRRLVDGAVDVLSADERVQAAWLQSRLAASTAAWKLVLVHDPPYASTSWAQSTGMRWSQTRSGPAEPVRAHRLRSVLTAVTCRSTDA